MEQDKVIAAVREAVISPNPWVLFKNQSFVIVVGPLKENETIEQKATDIMKTMGPVYAGSEHGDFNVTTLNSGWLVTSHCPVLFTYVAKEDMKDNAGNDMVIGLYGRQKRHDDSQDPQIKHVELKP